ncbi:MAG: NADP-dependent oxidoreductase [Verrucomicrobia bacterium]|nr:NADP-dependent oxidoreductase [Verrucomicrobiota bacterium]
MKAVCIYSYGGPGVLVYQEMPCPRPGPGEVLIRVHAAGINPIDWKVREGHLQAMLHHTLPLVLGWDLSGQVEIVGSGVLRLNVGDGVFSRPDTSRDGAYAEFIVVRETEVALKPQSIDHVHAAALPLAGLAAWQALFDTAHLGAGQAVLIHAAAGSVGLLAVQLAKRTGAHVIAVSSARDHRLLRRLGADEVVDYQAAPFEQVTGPVDVVLDTLGGDVQARSWKLIKKGGILVSLVDPPSAEIAASHGVRQAWVRSQPNATQLAELAKLVDAGHLAATVGKILPLCDAARGHQLGELGHTRGKIVLRVV